MFVKYEEEQKKIYFIHMTEFLKCSVQSCSETEPLKVHDIAAFELSNPNCIYYDKHTLFFGT